MRTLVWFRSDLRVRDNTALHHAALASGKQAGVVGVFLIVAAQWREHDWAGVKVDLILRSLRVLSEDLAALNIPLVIESVDRFDDVPGALLGLARRHGCGAIAFNREYEVNERRRDREVSKAFEGTGLGVSAFDDHVLLPPGAVRTGEGRYYTVFTPFKRAYFKELEARGLLDGPGRVLAAPGKQKPANVERSPVPDSVQGFVSAIDPALWPAGEKAALKRLDKFVSGRIRGYGEQRDLPAVDGTSTLSPYLAIGCISPRQCLHAAVKANDGRLEQSKSSLAGPTAWISELVWREFYRNIIVGFPRVSMGRAFKPATERIRWADDQRLFDAWRAGRTGVPIVDAGMRQLATTGWMHNRVRMITAMYLTKDLFIDWRWGERHFMRSLVDGDLAQNNGGWQWSASTGTDASPFFRIFNPVTQSRRFDPEGAYIRRYVPELRGLEGGKDGPIHDPSELPELARAGLDYPGPIVDRATVKDRVLRAFQGVA